jgi:uncharacterized protein (DUF427 family)
MLADVSRPERIEPGPGQESVWDYPRPPRVEAVTDHVVVELGGVVIADTRSAVRVLETSQPPAYYLPRDDIEIRYLVPTRTHTWCEWKGEASYFTVEVGDRQAVDAAWTYVDPAPGFEAIRGHVAFYAQLMDRCLVDDEVVAANAGSFYGGWITSKVVGPFKGAPGTRHW